MLKRRRFGERKQINAGLQSPDACRLTLPARVLGAESKEAKKSRRSFVGRLAPRVCGYRTDPSQKHQFLER